MEYEFDAVKDENDGWVAPGNKSPLTTVEGLLYMKVSSHYIVDFLFIKTVLLIQLLRKMV